MRSTLIALTLGALALSSHVSAAPAAKKGCEDCDAYKKGVSRRVVPTDDVVCIFFTQPRQDTVVLRLDLKDGTERRYPRKNAGTTGRICVGRGWLVQSNTASVCNGSAHADYASEHITIVMEKPKLSKKGEACLYGKEKCKAMGYQTRP